MILISYDIKDDKLRTRFAKFIKKFGNRVQYSVFEITHSDTMLSKIKDAIENEFETKFTKEDSVFIFETSKTCKITRFGFAKDDDNDVVIVE
jgi:CRISPR-associated protein Cas2